MSAAIKISHSGFLDPPILEGENVIAVLVAKRDGHAALRVKSLVLEKATPGDRAIFVMLLRKAADVIESGEPAP